MVIRNDENNDNNNDKKIIIVKIIGVMCVRYRSRAALFGYREYHQERDKARFPVN